MVKASAGLQAPFLFFLIVSVGWSQPALIHYQGRLVSGTNLVSGPVGLSLRLYNAISRWDAPLRRQQHSDGDRRAVLDEPR